MINECLVIDNRPYYRKSVKRFPQWYTSVCWSENDDNVTPILEALEVL